MKKIIFIIFCNLLLILIFLGILEFSLYKSYTRKHPEIKYERKEVEYENVLKYYSLRQPVGLEYIKKPILLAGCSFAYGQGLNEEQKGSYTLFSDGASAGLEAVRYIKIMEMKYE